jgi:DNA-binding transcriptional ArsR family regulator
LFNQSRLTQAVQARMELAILQWLEQHPWASFEQIANAVDESPVHVLSELRQLREHGLIEGLIEVHSAWELTDAGRAELHDWLANSSQ